MRLPSESWIYSMGLILDARGRYPVDLGVTVFPFFYTLNFAGSSFGTRPEPRTRWVGVFMMMTKLESSTESGKPGIVDYQTMSTEKLQPSCFWYR